MSLLPICIELYIYLQTVVLRVQKDCKWGKKKPGAFNLPLFFNVIFTLQNNSSSFQLPSEVLVPFEDPKVLISGSISRETMFSQCRVSKHRKESSVTVEATTENIPIGVRLLHLNVQGKGSRHRERAGLMRRKG